MKLLSLTDTLLSRLFERCGACITMQEFVSPVPTGPRFSCANLSRGGKERLSNGRRLGDEQ